MKIKLIKKNIFKTPFLLLALSCHIIVSGDGRSILGNLQSSSLPVQSTSQQTPQPQIQSISQLIPQGEPVGPAVDTKALDFKATSITDELKKTSNGTTGEIQKTLNALPATSKTAALRKTPSIASKELQNLNQDQIIRFSFEDASLENLVHYIEDLFSIKFFADDDIEPTPTGGALLKGHKITFKTNSPLTRDEAWNLFLKFLDIAGLTVVPTERKKFYYITSVTNANREVLVTYFNSKPERIPDNSGKVRYIFFVKNAPLATIQKIASTFASSTAAISAYPDLNAIIIIDKGSSIRSLMQIIQEFDKDIPECMSVLKLQRADAQDVAKLYADLTVTENPQGAGKLIGTRNEVDSFFFPPSARVLAEPRTNSLIILGSQSAITKIENFIKTTIDRSLDQPYSPLYIYELQYTQADNMQRILSQAVQFGANTIAGQFGGVRNGDQYFRPMTITADIEGNRLIIKAEENDYTKLKEMIKKLDVLQPQVAIEVLIVDVEVNDQKELGAQIRQKYPDQPVRNMQYATSGMSSGSNFYGVVTPTSGSSLLGNLIALATGQTAGATLLSLGSAATGGVWGMIRTLEQFGKTDIISNPFLLTTNGYTAQVSLGSTRRIQVATSLSAGAAQQGYQNIVANLVVTIKPQISTEGTIQMGININITDFASDTITDGNTFTKTIQTSAIVNDKEILVLGGVVKTTTSVNMSKVPILGDIPVIGWLFRNKQKIKATSNLLIFISPHVILQQHQNTANAHEIYTKKKADMIKDIMISGGAANAHDGGKDPVGKLYFDEAQEKTFGFLNEKTPHEYVYDYKRKRQNKALNQKEPQVEIPVQKQENAKKTRHQRRKEKQQQRISAKKTDKKDNP